MKLAVTTGLIALSLALPATAVSAQTPASGDELATATCADLMDLFSAAAPRKGKDPKRLARAQDDVLNFVMWVHGYVSGRDGIDFTRRPLNENGIKQTVAQIAEVCKPEPAKLFLDAIKNVE